jgi:hypothetical protein
LFLWGSCADGKKSFFLLFLPFVCTYKVRQRITMFLCLGSIQHCNERRGCQGHAYQLTAQEISWMNTSEVYVRSVGRMSMDKLHKVFLHHLISRCADQIWPTRSPDF